jgi:hypothetical protein
LFQISRRVVLEILWHIVPGSSLIFSGPRPIESVKCTLDFFQYPIRQNGLSSNTITSSFESQCSKCTFIAARFDALLKKFLTFDMGMLKNKKQTKKQELHPYVTDWRRAGYCLCDSDSLKWLALDELYSVKYDRGCDIPWISTVLSGKWAWSRQDIFPLNSYFGHISLWRTSNECKLCKIWVCYGGDYEEYRFLIIKTQFVPHSRHITSPLQTMTLFAVSRFLSHWWRKRYAPTKRRILPERRCVSIKKTTFLKTTKIVITVNKFY